MLDDVFIHTVLPHTYRLRRQLTVVDLLLARHTENEFSSALASFVGFWLNDAPAVDERNFRIALVPVSCSDWQYRTASLMRPPVQSKRCLMDDG